MVKRTLTVLCLALVFACGKDTLQTKPSIKVKELNGTQIPPGAILRVTLEFNDKEGDLGAGELTYVRDRLNSRPVPGAFDKADTARYVLPVFPDRETGDIDVDIPYDFMDEDPNDNDTMVFRFMVIDRAGNKSDTITSEQVVARPF
ncbi:MAG TPA: hypothetical protein VLC28_08285 [Flavitalea sp.]|nr:hypothetical protein [Flavitalea sp.]